LGFTLLVTRDHRPVFPGHQPSRRWLMHQGNQLAVIFDRQATGPTSFGPVSKPLNAFRIKAMQTTPYRLRATM
jgi:hypothetical protein